MFQISEVDAADLSFGDEDFLNLDDPFSVNFSSELKQANVTDQSRTSVPKQANVTDQSRTSVPERTAQHTSANVKTFSFKSKRSSPPSSDGRPVISISCSPNSLTTSANLVMSPVQHRPTHIPSQSNEHYQPTQDSYNPNMLVSPLQRTPKSKTFCWNKTSNTPEVGKAKHISGGCSEQICQRSALQILQKNMIIGSTQRRATTTVNSCQSNQSETIINTLNGPNTNTPSLQGTANNLRIQKSNNYNKVNNKHFQPGPKTNTSSLCDTTINAREVQMNNSYNVCNSVNPSSKVYQRPAYTSNNFNSPCHSKSQANSRLQENSRQYNRNESPSTNNSQRQQLHSSTHTPRLGTPSNRHDSPRFFHGSGASSLGDNMARPPEPVFSAAQTPHFTPRVAEMCRTLTDVKSVERTRLRKFPGPAGILPKLNSNNAENQFDVVFPAEPEENEEERIDLQSSQMATVDDFSCGAWKTMLQVLDIDPDDPQSMLMHNNVALVLRKASLKQLHQNKVTHMCVLLKTIHFNGTDASSILRDPTGEIQGTVHWKLMEDHKEELKPGSVLVLRQVGVLSPSLRNHYLNITPSNLVHVFPAEVKGQQMTQIQQDSAENHLEPQANNHRLKDFLAKLNRDRTNSTHQHSTMKTEDSANEWLNNNAVGRTQHLKMSQKQTKSRPHLEKRDSLTATEHAPKNNFTTGNLTADDGIGKRGNVGDVKSPKRVCLGSLPSAGNSEQGKNSTASIDLGENIDELLQGIEDELFEDF